MGRLTASGLDRVDRCPEVRPITGAEGCYVSRDGRVFSDRCRAGRRRRIDPAARHELAQITRKGYRLVSLHEGPRSRLHRVHHLVLAAWVGPRPPGAETRHLDGNKSNNHMDNLAWGTHAENEEDKVRLGQVVRGDAHWSRRQPERLARGERNGSRLHPDRLPRGEKNPASKLTDASVVELRALHAGGTSQHELARRFRISRPVVRSVVLRRTWRHVP